MTGAANTEPNPNPIADMGGEIIGKKTGEESSLSNWVGPYVTDILGRASALGEAGYQTYGGPLTAGSSDLQNQAFGGVAGLTLPTDMGAFNAGTFDSTAQAQYMNPYMEASLNPQIQAATQQAEQARLADAARLTQAGAYGGSRQAIMEAEGQRNLAQNIGDIRAAGLNEAYQQARQQFNTEQDRGMTAQELVNKYGYDALTQMANAGAVQRTIEGEGIAADKAQFEEERDFPYTSLQWEHSLLQGLPLAAQNYNFAQPNDMQKMLQMGGVLDEYGGINSLLSGARDWWNGTSSAGSGGSTGSSGGGSAPTT